MVSVKVTALNGAQQRSTNSCVTNHARGSADKSFRDQLANLLVGCHCR